MLSPFPGMDPYIEAPRIWSDFHGDLAGEIRAVLNRQIRPNYFAALTPYATYETIEVTQKNYVMLSRATHRPHVSVWPIALNARLPVLPIPLLEPDPDVLLDLGAVVASVYERGGYDARIDYRTPVPPPAVAEEETAWVEQLLTPLRHTM